MSNNNNRKRRATRRDTTVSGYTSSRPRDFAQNRELRGSREDYTRRNYRHSSRSELERKAPRGSSRERYSRSRAPRTGTYQGTSSRRHETSVTQLRTGASRDYNNNRARRAATPTNTRRAILRPLITIVSVLLVLAIIRLTFCAQQDQAWISHVTQNQMTQISTALDDPTQLYNNPYSWSNLKRDGDRFSYIVDGKKVSRLGIDVSEHNGSIDWSKVAADGIEFAYIRLGYRGTVAATIAQDSQFQVNLEGAQKAGLDIGVYFYSQAITEDEAAEEANYVIQTLAGTKTYYPVAFDMEPGANGSDRVSELSQEQITKVAAAFCRTLQAQGYNAVIYGSQQDLAHYDLESLTQYGFWYAEYKNRPTLGFNFALWQYSSKGSVSGIGGNVDLDLDLSAAR